MRRIFSPDKSLANLKKPNLLNMNNRLENLEEEEHEDCNIADHELDLDLESRRGIS